MTKLRRYAAAMLFAAAMLSPAHAGNVAYLSGGAGCPLFTGGLSQIAAQLDARGWQTHVGCSFPIGEIAAHRKDRVVLIGHSYGAAHAADAARALKARGMRVKVIAIDPLYTGATCRGVATCICYWGQGLTMPGAQNVHVASSYGHIGYPSDPRVQARVIAAVQR